MFCGFKSHFSSSSFVFFSVLARLFNVHECNSALSAPSLCVFVFVCLYPPFHLLVSLRWGENVCNKRILFHHIAHKFIVCGMANTLANAMDERYHYERFTPYNFVPHNGIRAPDLRISYRFGCTSFNVPLFPHFYVYAIKCLFSSSSDRGKEGGGRRIFIQFSCHFSFMVYFSLRLRVAQFCLRTYAFEDKI